MIKKTLTTIIMMLATNMVSAQSYTSLGGTELIKYPWNIQCSPKKCPDDWASYITAQEIWAAKYAKNIPARRGGVPNTQYNFNWVREKVGSSPACIAVPLTGGVWDLRISDDRPKVSLKGQMRSIADTRVSFLLPKSAGENDEQYLTYLAQVSLKANVCTVIRSPHSKVVPQF